MVKRKILAILFSVTLFISSLAGTSTSVFAAAIFDNCDSAANWTSSNSIGVDTSDKMEGTGSLTSTGISAVFFQKVFSTPVNIGETVNTGALQMWLYVSDVTKLGDGQIEITSSGTSDTNEYSWAFASINSSLVNGWNKVYLKLSEAGTYGGAPNLSSINFVRIYNYVSASITMKIDDLRFVTVLTAKPSDDVLQLTVQNGNNGTQNYYLYNTFSTSSYTFQTGDYLEYDIKLIDSVNGAGGVDCTATDGTSLRDLSGWQDQCGVIGHPAADLRAYANNVWHHRKLAIPAAMVGKVAAKWNIAGENDTANQYYNSMYDNILITNGTGTERKVVFKSASDSDINAVDLTAYTTATMIFDSVIKGSGDCIKLTVTNDATASHYYYNKFSTASYTFQAGDYIEYDVKILNNTAGAGGIDCITTDSTNLRDQAGWQDQNGISGHPAADISAYAYNTWYHRKMAVPSSMVGKVAGRWDVVGESDTPSLSYSAIYDNIFVTSSTGASKKIIFSNKWNSDINSADVWVLASTASMTFTSPAGASLTPTAAANPGVITTTYATSDIVVASCKVTDSPYNADNTGVIDATAAINTALNDCYLSGGGVVFMPAGKYKITSKIEVPTHVTLRGDWQDPDVGTSYGTIIMANVSNGINETPALINIMGSGGVNGLTVYYPNQSATNPVAYPYTFLLCAWGEGGRMSSTVQNVTLLNSYKGIITCNNNEMHNIFNVKGTVLKKAIRLQNTSDVGRLEKIKIDNSYWSNAGAAYNAPARSTLDDWTRANGMGMEISDVEWENFVNISLSDYSTGILFTDCTRINSCGTMFGVSVVNTNKALVLNKMDPRVGVSFSNCTFKANQGTSPVAVEINDPNGSGAIFNTCTIGGGATNAVILNSDDIANFQNCTFDSWTGTYAIVAATGSVVVEGCTFTPTLTSTLQGINLSGTASGSILGNTFTGDSIYLLTNTSTGDVKRQDTGYSFPKLSVTDHTWKTSLPKPSTTNFYNAALSPYNADKTGTNDAASAIQSALDAASTAGGGTVYLPAGQYKVNTHLTIPANVELRGSDDGPHRADYRGSVLYVYEGYNSATADTDTAFITLNGAGAGVKGVTIYYPNMPNTSSTGFVPYPYAIRGNGSSVYAMNVAFVNAFKGVDFATNRCDNHYINSVNGCVLKDGIKVGGGSIEGWIEDCHFNGTYWTRTDLANWIPESEIFNIIFPYTRSNFITFQIGDAANEHLLNDFAYGPNTGFKFYLQNSVGANAVAINSGVDGSWESYRVDGTGATGLTLINQEACGVFGGTDCDVVDIASGTVKIFGLISMEGNDLAIRQTGGTTIIQGAMFHHKAALVAGGTASVWNGIFFKDTGNQLTVNDGVTNSNFWGNIGSGGFVYTNNAGTGASFSNNITR